MTDDDVSLALEAKSDQLNAVDIVGSEPVIKIREVKINNNANAQKIWVYFEGDNGRPWKPCKGMGRILMAAWGPKSSVWIGKHVKLFIEPTVIYAGKEVGGIEIRSLSDIPDGGINVMHVKNQKQRGIRHFPLLVVAPELYPADRFEKALPIMAAKMEASEMTLQQVIAQCQKTGQLTQDQLSRLEQAAPKEPIEINDDNEDEEVY